MMEAKIEELLAQAKSEQQDVQQTKEVKPDTSGDQGEAASNGSQ